jgi:hypothetical protein
LKPAVFVRDCGTVHLRSVTRRFGIYLGVVEVAALAQPQDSSFCEEPRCIFCLASDNAPSLEHVVPAGLGKHLDIVLPRGAVCEPCNNYLGRQVDEALVHLFEVQLIRGYYRVPDRRGRRIKSIPLRNGTISFPDDGPMKVEVHGDEHFVEGDESVTVTAIAKRQRSGDQFRRAARALMKMGLCLVCYGHGHQAALESSWNRLRRIIGGAPYEGYVLMGSFDIHKPPHMTANLITDLPGVTAAAQLQFGGLDLIVDLEPGPVNEDIRSWAECNGYRITDITPKPGHPVRRLPSGSMTVKVNIDVSYEVESDNPASEEVGLRLLEEETQTFASAIRDRFAEAGIAIEKFATKQS